MHLLFLASTSGLSDVVIWLILLVAFIVLEGMTLLLVSIWFAGGALAALIAAALGANLVWQITIFVIVSIILLIIGFSLRRYWLPGKHKVATNADRILNQAGRVIVAIDPVNRTGQIEVMGQIWSAVTEDESELPLGARIEVVDIRGVRAIIRPLEPDVTEATEGEM